MLKKNDIAENKQESRLPQKLKLSQKKNLKKNVPATLLDYEMISLKT